ncbi:RHS repeat-associated core domain-containing protein [Bradyrhizobium icense]|uniref:RHS repeat-associated core domain-containing protein n=1 Tax=Bradyrhizobium icense TaxID=1274631 RepID=UPI0018D3C6EF|nr:RHS repeat-associated core domain-containing protein [Bradyrhizobium icense]
MRRQTGTTLTAATIILSSGLISVLCFSPLAFAQEASEGTTSAEVASSSPETTPTALIYFFVSEGGQIWGVLPIYLNVAAICTTQIATSTDAENPAESPPDPECGLLVLNYGTSTQVGDSGEVAAGSGVATTSPATRYIHPDHLGSTNIVTDEGGAVIETLDYFPYGLTRVSTGIDASARKYIGLFKDSSDLIYANARYYNANVAQFISQDPVFLAIGDAKKLNELTGLDQQTFLADPQAAHSYSYARNNPITNKDPKGLQFAPALAPMVGIELLSGPVGWAALGLTTALYAAYLLHSLGEPNWQTMQLVNGQGYNTDPKLPPKPPGGPWGFLAWTSAITATGIGAFNEYVGPLLQPNNGLQPLHWPNGSNPPFFTGAGPVVSLPPMVIQSGTTYYRNSSGLLSTTPQPIQPQGGTKNSSSGGGGGSPTQTSSNNGGWGSTHTACGKLCM